RRAKGRVVGNDAGGSRISRNNLRIGSEKANWQDQAAVIGAPNRRTEAKGRKAISAGQCPRASAQGRSNVMIGTETSDTRNWQLVRFKRIANVWREHDCA